MSAVSKDDTLQALTAFRDQVAAENLQKRHAAMWQRLAATHIDQLVDMVNAAPATDVFLSYFEQ